MNDFEFFINTRIRYGIGLYKQIGDMVRGLNYSKILICTDRNIENLESFACMLKLLKQNKINFAVFSDIEINPTLKTIENVRDHFSNKNFDLIITIGGGGPIDVGKAASVALTHEGDLRDYIAGSSKEINKNVLPIISIPTTAGSGAEVSPVSVIVDGERQLKIGFFSEYLFPILAIIDPILYTTLPPKQTAECGLDVLSHSFDSFVSPFSNFYSQALSIKSINLVFNNLVECVYNGKNLSARGAMAMASVIALIAMYIGKGGATHTIGEPLGTLYKISHGYACGIAIPSMMEFLMSVCEENFIEIYKNINDYADPRDKKRDVAVECIKEIKKLIVDIGLDGLNSYIKSPDISLLSKYSIQHLAVDRIPRIVKEEDYKSIYKNMLEQDYLNYL